MGAGPVGWGPRCLPGLVAHPYPRGRPLAGAGAGGAAPGGGMGGVLVWGERPFFQFLETNAAYESRAVHAARLPREDQAAGALSCRPFTLGKRANE